MSTVVVTTSRAHSTNPPPIPGFLAQTGLTLEPGPP